MEMTEFVKKAEKLGYSKTSAEQIVKTGLTFVKNNYPNLKILEKPLGRIRKLQQIKNPNTKRNVVKALFVLQRITDSPAYDKSVKYYKTIFGRAMKARQEESRQPVDTEEFDKKREEIESDFDRVVDSKDNQMILMKLPRYLLLRIMTDLPTRRANDYRTLLLKKPSENANKSNYYSRGKLYFNDFKSKTMGQVQLSEDQKITKFFPKARTKDGVMLEVDEEVKELFNLLRKLDRGRKYLIEGTRGNPKNPAAFSKWIKENYGMTINDFRKMYVQKHVDSKEIDNAKQVAEDMSNTLATQQRDYRERE